MKKRRRWVLGPLRVRRRSSDRGASLAEMALLTPLFLLMLLGVMDFGRAFYTGITTLHAAKAGAQYGAQSNATTADFAGMEQAAIEEAQDLGTISVTVQRFCECPSSAVVVDCITGSCGVEGAPEIYVKVTAERTFTTLFPYPGVPDTVVMARTAVLRVQ